MRLARFLAKIVTALSVGMACALLWVQYDERFRDLVHDRVSSFFKNTYNVRFCAQSCILHPFSLSCVMSDVHVEPLQSHAWSWSAQSIEISCNPLTFFFTHKVRIRIALHTVGIKTEIKGADIAVVDHIQNFIHKDDSPYIDVDYISINNITALYSTKDYVLHGDVKGSVSIEKQHEESSVSVKVDDGSLWYADKHYISNFQGTSLIVSDTGDTKPVITVDCLFKNPQFPSESRYMLYGKGSWDGSQGSCMVHTEDRSIALYPCTFALQETGILRYEADIVSAIDSMKYFFMSDCKDTIDGTCTLHIAGTTQGYFEGICKVQQASYKHYGIDSGSFSCKTMHKGLEIDGSWEYGSTAFEGTAFYNFETHEGSYTITNVTDLPLYGYWNIADHSMKVQGAYTRVHDHAIDYEFLLYNTKTEETIRSSGSAQMNIVGLSSIRGMIDRYSYAITFDSLPSIPTTIVCWDTDGKELLKATCKDNKTFDALLDYDLVRIVARSFYNHFLPGEGKCSLRGIIDTDMVTGEMHIFDARIRLPNMFNFITNLDAKYTYNIVHKRLDINDVLLTLHRGTIKSSALAFEFSSRGFPSFVHIPLCFYHCFANLNKQIYGVFTGSVVYQYKHEQGMLSGFCLLESLAIKDNIFGSELYASLQENASTTSHALLENTTLDIAVQTQKPATITTPVITTKAHVHCAIHNTIHDPRFDGIVSLQGGDIMFPAYPLSINRGIITFDSHQHQRYQLDIVAHGRVKKYLISMLIGGSVQDPTITLQSNPTLTQEQIIMLLFGGTEEQSFNVMAPALLMYNAHNFLFHQSQADPSQNMLIPGWMQPFKKIAFIPRFTDQTGRGGLKGAIEIEVNDRLRGSIEKNFSLSENFSAEVEYLLSDDVGLRATRDDRGDLGAEIEMKFKF